jgi:bacterioferritin
MEQRHMSSPTPAQPASPTTPVSSFVSDITAIRERARLTMADGAITPSYGLDAETVVRLLNDALATEIVCTLRYRRHYYCAEGIHSESVKKEFLEHANQELAHADKIAERIVQLNGAPDFSPQTLTQRSHADYVEGVTLRDMIAENLVAERIAIESYLEMIQFVSDRDPTTRRMLEAVLADEEEHADDMASLLKRIGS